MLRRIPVRKPLVALVAIALTGQVLACAEEAVEETDSRVPQVTMVEKSALVVGETLNFFGENFLDPADGKTKLTFEGTFYWTDGSGQPVPEKVAPFTIAPLYDELATDAEVNNVPLQSGAQMLRWNRFGPFEVPFGTTGNRTGVFKGTVTAVNHFEDGTTEASVPTEISIEIKPSIIIKKLEPVVDTKDGKVVTAGCGAPALRGLGGMPYVIEVEAIGFTPAYFIYEISNINGVVDGWTEFTHAATGATDRVGDPSWHPNEIVVFNSVGNNEGFAHAAIRVTAVDANNNTYFTALPLSIVRPMGFNYDGNRELAEYYEPVAVHGPIVGGIGTVVSYAESHTEARQQGVSVTISKTWSQSQGKVATENWTKGVSTANTKSTTNSEGVAHTESETSSETYGTTHQSSNSTSADFSSSKGSDWGWNTTTGLTEEEYKTKMGEVFGSASASVNTSVTGEGSVPGFAKVSGTVGTTFGVEAGAKVGTTNGEKVSTKTDQGEHAYQSEGETSAYGSTTMDSTSESLSGTYALGSQSTINSSTAQTDAQTNSTTFEMGGSGSITENVTEGSAESWEETWVNTSSDTTLLNFSGKVPRNRCAVVYRQTVRYVRRAQVYSYDLCGVRTLVGETVFNEWTWSPNIAIGDDCEKSLPPSSQPKAACFLACE